MKKKVLITGITGLIGKAVLTKLLSFTAEYDITALVRPHTNKTRYQSLAETVTVEFLDLSNISGLQAFLETKRYDAILHIGALRGGRKATRRKYYLTNIASTEQFIEHCLKNKSRLIFCSSVGVFGAIPDEMPANNESPRKEDNYYHYTKIMAEKAINKAMMNGLEAVIVRPAITYGVGDNGFPASLVKMVANRFFPLSNKRVWIHLCHIETISTAIIQLLTTKADISGKAYNVADQEPIQLKDLVNFISRQISNTNYPKLLTIDSHILALGESIARVLKNELLISRFELISHSWFYKVTEVYTDLELPMHYTIPAFKLVIDEYKKSR